MVSFLILTCLLEKSLSHINLKLRLRYVKAVVNVLEDIISRFPQRLFGLPFAGGFCFPSQSRKQGYWICFYHSLFLFSVTLLFPTHFWYSVTDLLIFEALSLCNGVFSFLSILVSYDRNFCTFDWPDTPYVTEDYFEHSPQPDQGLHFPSKKTADVSHRP